MRIKDEGWAVAGFLTGCQTVRAIAKLIFRKETLHIGQLYRGPAGPYEGKEQGGLQSHETAADLLFPGGAHRSAVFLFLEKDGKHQRGRHGDDGRHDAALFCGHV